MLKLLMADNFYNDEDINRLYGLISSLNFVQKEHGLEINNFNYNIPGMDEIFSKLVGEKVTVDEDNSGVFRKPNLRVHFESFQSSRDWVFVLALEETVFNLHKHISGTASAIEEYKYDYSNFLEWDYYTNILLKPNQGILFRPWLFHSFTHQRLIQIYRLTDSKNE